MVKTDNKPVRLFVVDRVKEYPYGASRANIAKDFDFGKSTAQGHLEKAVRRGELAKFYGWISDRYRGWIYIDPEAAPKPFWVDTEDAVIVHPDLINDERYRQMDNLQDSVDFLDHLGGLSDDELQASLAFMTQEVPF